jgi:hypothetical protein
MRRYKPGKKRNPGGSQHRPRRSPESGTELRDSDMQTVMPLALSRATNLAVVDEADVLEAQGYIYACEQCAENAVITFDYVLDGVTGCDPILTEYVMCRAARCPRCRSEVSPKTRVVPY